MPILASSWKHQWRQFKLTPKFGLILSTVFVAATGIAGIVVYRAVNAQAEHELASRGQLLMTLVDQLEAEDSAAEAHPVVSTLCESKPSLCYKVLVPDADFLAQDTDELAVALKEQFQNQPDQQTLSGYITHADQEHYYLAHRQAVDGTLQVQAIFIPTAPAKELANSHFWMEMGIFIVFLGLTLLLVHELVRRTVLKPIQPMTQLAHRLSQDLTLNLEESSPEIQHLRHHAQHADEIGQLAGVFHRLLTAFRHRSSTRPALDSVSSQDPVPNSVQALLSTTQITSTHQLLAKARQIRQQIGQTQEFDLLQCLQSVDFLQGFTEAQLQDLVASGYQRQYEAGEIIFREGELGQMFYIVLKGVIQSQVDHPERQGNKLVSGDAFGETALLSGVARQTTIQAVEQTTLFLIEDDAFQRLMRQYPQLGNRLIQRQSQLAEILRRVDYFQNWSEIQFQQLLDRGYRQNLAAGGLFKPEAAKLYVVISGSVQVEGQGMTLKSGECWGDLSLLFDDLPNISGQTLSQTSLFILETSDLFSLLKRYPQLVDLTANTLWQRQPPLQLQGQGMNRLPANGLNWIRDRLQSQLPPV